MAAAGEGTTTYKSHRHEVANYKGNREIVIEPSIKDTVFLYKCEDTVVQVRGKCKSVEMEQCKGSAVVCETLVQGITVNNSKKCQAQTTGFSPLVQLEKVADITVYLPAERASEVSLITSQIDSVNIVINPADETSEPVEAALPMQFETKFVDGKFVTKPVSHA
eukprot:GABV01003563.1.p2 GENE.GABV01003563.1~~GABV01003563.1.p2  ORF type:complete len:173 (-),score=55.76 GABV01003563.1:27-518(-)